ncbi:MAG TPA: thrombospondin type 3 repeat-containing protein, partial [Verrucomicrobiae bacterium]
TQLTDTDHDGMSDYAEFIAGTNPTNAASRFYFAKAAQTNHLFQLEWTVVSNRLYQVSASTNLSSWPPVTGWLQASNDPTMSYIVTNAAGGAHFYRVQVQP